MFPITTKIYFQNHICDYYLIKNINVDVIFGRAFSMLNPKYPPIEYMLDDLTYLNFDANKIISAHNLID